MPAKTRHSNAWARAGLPARFEKLRRDDPRSDLGSGASGEVERGWDAEKSAYVAVKKSGKHLAHTVQREYDALKKLNHPNVMRVLASGRRDVGTPRDRAYLVSEHIQGDTLSEAYFATTPRAVFWGIASGLAHVHRAGLFHNDLHDENVMVSGHRAVLIDFGTASNKDRSGDEVPALLELITYHAMRCGSTDPDLVEDAEDLYDSPLVHAWRGGVAPTDAQLRREPLFARQDMPTEPELDLGPPCKRRRRA